MKSRERLRATLDHREPDRLCVDFGSTGVTGIGVCAVNRLRQRLLGGGLPPVRVTEPYQMLGELEPRLLDALGADVAGLPARNTLFGFPNHGWKPFTMPDGTAVQVPAGFVWATSEDGSTLVYPQGDASAAPCAAMPATGYFFDSLDRQQPLVEERLDPADNCEEFAFLTPTDVDYYRNEVARLRAASDRAIVVGLPGTAFGDIALVPAMWLKAPRGIRSVEEWYASTACRRDYIHAVFARQCEIAVKNVEFLAAALGDAVDAAYVSGTDFGTQRGPFVSRKTYRELYMPYQKAVNDRIHALTGWKTFMHSCGSVYGLIPDFIEAGFDILNPVQCSAAEMEPRRLKREFGPHLVFWGGGIDTQRTLPFGTPDEVYKEVRERIDIFAPGGGYVFNTIHNIQSNVPAENLLAMVRALMDSRM